MSQNANLLIQIHRQALHLLRLRHGPMPRAAAAGGGGGGGHGGGDGRWHSSQPEHAQLEQSVSSVR